MTLIPFLLLETFPRLPPVSYTASLRQRWERNPALAVPAPCLNHKAAFPPGKWLFYTISAK